MAKKKDRDIIRERLQVKGNCCTDPIKIHPFRSGT